MKRAARLLLFCLVAAFLAGCGASTADDLESLRETIVSGNAGSKAGEMAREVGEKAREGAQSAGEMAREGARAVRQEGGALAHEAKRSLSNGWLRACLILRGHAAFIVTLSILAGMILMDVFPANAEIRKFGLVTLCIRIPVLTLACTYLTAFAYGALTGWTDEEPSRAVSMGICRAWYAASKGVIYPALTVCVLSILLGLFIRERFRDNPDYLTGAGKYLCKRIPLAVFLSFVAYPLLYELFS